MKRLFYSLFIAIGFISSFALNGLQTYEEQPKTIDEVNQQIEDQTRKINDLNEKQQELQDAIDEAKKEKDRLANERLKVPMNERQAIDQQIMDQAILINKTNDQLNRVTEDLNSSEKELNALKLYKEQLMGEYSPSEPGQGKQPIQPAKPKTIVDSLISSLVDIWTKLKTLFSKDVATQRAKNSLKIAQKNLIDYENKFFDAHKIDSWQDRLDLRSEAQQYGSKYNQLVSDYNQAEKNYQNSVSKVIKAENPYADQIKQLKSLKRGQLEEFGSLLVTANDDQINNYLNNRYQEEYKSTNPYSYFGIYPKESIQYTLDDIEVLYKNLLQQVNSFERSALVKAYNELQFNKATIDSNIAYLTTELDAYNASLHEAIAQAQKQVFIGL